MSEEEIKQMKKVLKQQWGDTDNLVNDALCYINKLEEENKNRISESLAYDLAKARVQELEHIIKEVREYVTQHMMEVAKTKGINGEENGAIYVAVADLLEILDKEKE